MLCRLPYVEGIPGSSVYMLTFHAISVISVDENELRFDAIVPLYQPYTAAM